MGASYRQLLDAGQAGKQQPQSARFAEDEDDSNFEDQPETASRPEVAAQRGAQREG